MNDDEQEWVRELIQQNRKLEQDRYIQPGHGYTVRENESDWWILGIVVLVIIAGIFS